MVTEWSPPIMVKNLPAFTAWKASSSASANISSRSFPTQSPRSFTFRGEMSRKSSVVGEMVWVIFRSSWGASQVPERKLTPPS